MILRFLSTLLSLLVCLSGYATSKRALLVGIGQYDRVKTGWTSIHGDKDVELLKPLLKKQGFADVKTLKNSQATKSAIVSELKLLARRCEQGDKVYFHFSGHGQPIRDDNKDEGNAKLYDESVIPYDACRDSRKMGGKYAGQNHLIDDELCPLLDAIKRKLGPSGELFVVVDACFSKGVEKDEFTELDPDIVRFVRGTDHPFTPPGRSSYLAQVPKPKRYTPGAKMYVATACKSDERNFEYKSPAGKMYGALSYYVSTLLKTDADFSRWTKCFTEKSYTGQKIFQTVQHPGIVVYP